MQDQGKTREQLIDELNKMRRKVAEFEAAEGKSLGPGKILLPSEGLREIEKNLSGKRPNILSPDNEIEQDEFAKVVDIPQIQSLMDDFYKLTNIGIAILDLKGNILVANGWHDICTKFHRVHPETLKNCLESDVYLTENVREGEYLLYKCKNNMWDVVTPIFMGGKHVGNIFYGQFLFEDEAPDIELFAAQAERYGFDKSEYLAALQRVLRWSNEKTADLMRFYSKLASMIGQLSHSNLKLEKTLIESKMFADALRESEEKYRNLVESIGDVIFEIDGRGALTYISPAVRNAFGYEAEDFVGKTFLEFVHPEDRGLLIERFAELTKGVEYPLEYRVVGKSGEVHDVRTHTKPILKDNAFEGARGTFIDITERKRSEEAVQRSEKFLEQVLENIPNMIFVKDAENLRFVRFNKAGEDLLGYSREDLLGKNDYDFFPPAQADFFVAKDRSVLVEGKLLDISEEEIETKNKGKRILHTKKIPILNADGTAQFLLGISEDITERKQFEESQRLLSTAIEQAAEAVVITDSNGIIQYVNPAEEKSSGYGRDELIGKGVDIFKSDKHDDIFYGDLWATIRSGKVWTGHFINRKKDGSLYHEDATISPVYDQSGNLANFVSVKHDITKQIELQEQLFQAQKMEAIGNLAGGFAHDFRNMLQVVMGSLELIEFNKDLPDHLRTDLARIRKAATSGAELVKGMLVFSRKTSVQLEPLNLNELVEQVESLLARTIPKMIKMDVVKALDLSSIKGNSTQIEQILMNLAINAADAMPDGGTLTIRTVTTVLDEKFCSSHPGTKPGRYVLLSVTDTGSGMNEETIRRIFEPFFTTKGKGKGTGLGLAVVYGIVEQHAARIICESKPAIGTSFKIYFPAIEEVTHEQLSEKTESPKGQGETILVVDDEPEILEMISHQLTGANYKVIRASNARDAVELYEKHREEIQLVLLDLIMPEIGGKQCLEALRNMGPNIKVIIITGHNRRGMTQELKEAGARDFILKPFDTPQLLEKIRKIIDEE
ncbi:MAG: PAS domain S-box protein [Pseudomonadota bacterium]